MKRWLPAVFLVAIAAGLAARAVFELRSAPLPRPSRGVAVNPTCPPMTSADYFFPEDVVDAGTGEWMTGLVRAAAGSPLWCGNRTDIAYRFMLVFEWGKSKVITVAHSGGRWMLEGVEFKHPVVARFAVNRRVEKRLSEAEADSLVAALDRADFWWLEPVAWAKTYSYDGPIWVIEGRAPYGYHMVRRDSYAKVLKEAGRQFMKLAGLEGERNTPPWEP